MSPSRSGSRWLFLVVSAGLWTATVGKAAEDAPDFDKTLAQLNEITGEDAIKGQIKTLVADKSKCKAFVAAAAKKLAKDPKAFSYNAAYILAECAVVTDQFDEAVALYKHCSKQAIELKSGTKLAQSFGGYIDLLYQHEKYAEAEEVCKEILEIKDPGPTLNRIRGAVYRRMIQTVAKQGKIKEALKLVDNLLKLQPKNWFLLELKGWVLREGGELGDSARIYHDVIELISKDEDLDDEGKESFIENVRYILSGVYVDMKKIDKATEQLEALLAKKPDDPTYNNDLGYIWADNDLNLDKAEKMIRKAIEEDRKLRKANPDLVEDKDNPAYLDSLAWVLHKKGEHKEAKKILLEVVKEKEGRHIEIYDHLAEVHMALGEKKEAIEAWKKGLEVAGTNKREQERKAKVEKKLKDAEMASK
jgi:tetratricopeptide (TPR) repeat protein